MVQHQSGARSKDHSCVSLHTQRHRLPVLSEAGGAGEIQQK